MNEWGMRTSVVLAAVLAIASGCGGDGAGNEAGDGAGGVTDPGGGGSGGTGATGGSGGSGGTSEEPGTPTPGAPLLFRPLAKGVVLVDTANPANAACSGFSQIGAGNRRLVIDLDDCNLADDAAADAVGFVGGFTVFSDDTETFEVRVASTGAADAGAPNRIGPKQSSTHGFFTGVSADERTFAIEVGGSAAADLVVEMSTVLVPAEAGGDFAHFLDVPEHWFAAQPNLQWCSTHSDPFIDIDTVHRYPVVAGDAGATGMFGAIQLGTEVWRSERASFYMGPALPSDAGNQLTRWVSSPPEGHHPFLYSGLFATGTSAAGEIELRATAHPEVGFDRGVEPRV